MKFSVFVALLGSASAVTFCGNAPAAPVCGQQQFSCDDQSNLQLPAYNGNNLKAQLGAGEGCTDGYGKLSSESASSKTTIGASQITIPDKHIVTDQAKVHEEVAKGERQAQTCQVARRKFSISGEITVDEKYNDNLKGDDNSKKCGQGASQTRSRTQVLNVCTGGNASVPITAPCVARQASCGCINQA
jgi:hypothetical protein